MSPTEPPSKEPPKETPLNTKQELDAINESFKYLEKLSPEGRNRAFSFLASALGYTGTASNVSVGPQGGGAFFNIKGKGDNAKNNGNYQIFADLYNAARPETGTQKALVGGYWFQIVQQKEDFVALEVNDELKNIGATIGNITVAFNNLKGSNPALVLQVRKTGKAQQARKQYRLTVAGIKAVEEMLNRPDT